MNLVCTICKASPTSILHHACKRRIGRIAQCTVYLNGAVDDAVQTVRHKVLRHRHFRTEIFTLVNLVGRMQDHQLALI